jgi:hypothetical protein
MKSNKFEKTSDPIRTKKTPTKTDISGTKYQQGCNGINMKISNNK